MIYWPAAAGQARLAPQATGEGAMVNQDPLATYRRKRDFSRTAEPMGGRRAASKKPLFVIQQHDATAMHYDFRLEVDGVLKSWAVPKGPSTDPRVRRLALPTEDHPLDYIDFEGVIPEGEYGAGAVIVWDTGTYRNLMAEKDEPLTMAEALAAGHAEVWLDGQKLRGGYALIRTDEGYDEKWLLIKMKDEGADARRRPANTQPRSVLSGRTVAEVEAGEGPAGG
jgi:DNA ligase D-like protein (predicted 3'-phosphoesterase)